MPNLFEVNDATKAMRIAVELLTVWLDRGTPALEAGRYIVDVVLDGPDAPSLHSVIIGQPSLAEHLILMLANERGAEADDLRAKAHEILQELSPRLPE